MKGKYHKLNGNQAVKFRCVLLWLAKWFILSVHKVKCYYVSQLLFVLVSGVTLDLQSVAFWCSVSQSQHVVCGAWRVGLPAGVVPQSSGCVLGPSFPTVITREDCLAAAHSAAGVLCHHLCRGLLSPPPCTPHCQATCSTLSSRVVFLYISVIPFLHIHMYLIYTVISWWPLWYYF